jgi:hypothetical protein
MRTSIFAGAFQLAKSIAHLCNNSAIIILKPVNKSAWIKMLLRIRSVQEDIATLYALMMEVFSIIETTAQ